MIYLIAFFVILESFKIIQSSLMTVIDLESHNWPEQPSVPPWYWYSMTSKIKIENSKKIQIFEIFKNSKFFLGIKRNWTEDRNKWNYWPVYWSYRRKLMVSQKYFFFHRMVCRGITLSHTLPHGMTRYLAVWHWALNLFIFDGSIWRFFDRSLDGFGMVLGREGF